MKKDNLLTQIENELKTHQTNLHYKIEARLEFSDEYYDITDMFGTPELLRELKVKHRIIALDESGYTQLLQLGFKSNKIEKRY